MIVCDSPEEGESGMGGTFLAPLGRVGFHNSRWTFYSRSKPAICRRCGPVPILA